MIKLCDKIELGQVPKIDKNPNTNSSTQLQVNKPSTPLTD